MVAALPELPRPGRPSGRLLHGCGRGNRLRRLALARDLQRPLPHGLAAADRRGRRAVADLARRPDAAGHHAAACDAGGGGVDRVRRVRGRRRGLSPALRGPGLPADRAAPLEAGDALRPGREQPRHQHRARGARALAPDRARALGGGDRAPGRRCRRGAGAGRGAADRVLPPAGGAGRARHPGDPRARGVAHLLHRRGVGFSRGSGRSSSRRPRRRRPGRSPASTTSRSP